MGNNSWLSLWYLSKRRNISWNLTKDTSHHILRRLLNANIAQVGLDSQKGRKKDLNIETTQKIWRADATEHWQMEKVKSPSTNSIKLHGEVNSKKESIKNKNLKRETIFWEY